MTQLLEVVLVSGYVVDIRQHCQLISTASNASTFGVEMALIGRAPTPQRTAATKEIDIQLNSSLASSSGEPVSSIA